MARELEPEGLNHEERVSLIEAIYRIVGQVEKRFDALRDTDRDAVKLAHMELSARLEGFPQQYATKVEMEQAALTLRRLENTTLSREVYEQRHVSLSEEVDTLEREMLPRAVFETFADTLRGDLERAAIERGSALPRSVFDTFVENYRLELGRTASERRSLDEVLARATDQVRDQVIAERADFLTQEVYDQRHQALVQQVNAVERWQYKIVGGLVFATFIAPLLTGLIVYTVTTGF